MSRFFGIASCAVVGLAVAACQSAPATPEAAAAEDCVASAYETGFSGTQDYDAQERAMLGPLMAGADDPTNPSEDTRRRVTSQLGGEKAELFLSNYMICMDNAL